MRIGRLVKALLTLSLCALVPSLTGPLQAAEVKLAWDANPEPDIAGYRVWYTGPLGTATADVGNVTTASVPDLSEGTSYAFSLTAYNTAGLESDPSSPIHYTVPGLAMPPAIITQPVGQSVNLGSPFSLLVIATGNGPLSYQWFRNGAELAGATAGQYSVSAAKSTDAGLYQVRVSNQAGYTLSASVSVVMITPPVITTQPASLTAAVGTMATFSVQATGSNPLAYQWYQDGVALPGAVGPSLALSSVQSAHAGVYHVTVSNPAGSVRSANAVLNVLTSTKGNKASGTNNGKAGRKTSGMAAMSLPGESSLISLPNGMLLISAMGTPWVVYEIQTTEQVAPADWSTIASVVAAEDGLVQISTLDPEYFRSRLYRIVPRP